MRPTVRGKSGSKKLQPSAILEREAKEMEEKLKQLKKQMASEKEKRSDILNQSGSRWSAASTSKPIKNYSAKLIEEKNNFLQKTGQKLGGTASFTQNKNSTMQKKSSLMMTQQPQMQRNNSRPDSKSKVSAGLPNKNNFMEKTSNIKNSQNQENNSLNSSQNKGFQPNLQQQQQPQSIENNLQKHLQIQKGKEKDHIQFLQELNLSQYLERFEENGFDDLETIIELNTELLNEMMIPAGHQIKIMKKVDKLRQENNLAPQKEHILNQYKTSNYKKNNQNQAIQKRTDLVELEYEEPVTEKHSIAIGDEPVVSQKKTEFDGEFNEKESHQSFLDALMEWRGQKPENKQQQNEVSQRSLEKKKSVKFQDDVVDNEGKTEYRKPGGKQYKPSQNSSGQQAGDSSIQQKSQKKPGGLFFMGGEQNYDNDHYTTNHDSDTQTANMEIPVIHDKTPCWQCYKLFSQSVALSHQNKLFCSQNCLNTFLKDQSVKCGNEKCDKREQKDKSIFENGLYFCSQTCVINPSVQQKTNQAAPLTQNQNKTNKSNHIEERDQKINQSNNNNLSSKQQKEYKLEDDQIAQLERPFSQVVKESSQNSTNASFLLDLEGEKLNQRNGKQNSGLLSLAELENKYKQVNLQKSQLHNKENIQNNSQISTSQLNQQEQDEDDGDILADSLDMR